MGTKNDKIERQKMTLPKLFCREDVSSTNEQSANGAACRNLPLTCCPLIPMRSGIGNRHRSRVLAVAGGGGSVTVSTLTSS